MRSPLASRLASLTAFVLALPLILSAQSTVTLPSSGTVWTSANLPAKVDTAWGTVALGKDACPSAANSGNTCVGWEALKDATSANYNSAFGMGAMWRTTTGDQNAAFGSYALRFLTTGGSNTAVGHGACATITTANYNTCVGAGTFTNAINSQYSTGVGFEVGKYTTYGYSNTAIGHHALFTNTTGAFNVGLGQASLYLNTTGHRNIGIGYHAGPYAPTAMTGSLSSGTANLGIGQYNYRVAFVLDGQPTALGDVLTVITTSAQREVSLTSIPTYTGSLTCSARLIYRSPVGDTNQSTYKLAHTITDCTTAALVDTLPDTALGAAPSDPSDAIAIGHGAKYTKSGQAVIGTSSTTEYLLPGLTGAGNAYACLDAAGKLYRSATACQ